MYKQILTCGLLLWKHISEIAWGTSQQFYYSSQL